MADVTQNGGNAKQQTSSEIGQIGAKWGTVSQQYPSALKDKNILVAQKNEEITGKNKSPDELPWPFDNREPPGGMNEPKHDKVRKPFWPVKRNDPRTPRDDDAPRHGPTHHDHVRKVNYHSGASGNECENQRD
jgi:hypothetical protein